MDHTSQESKNSLMKTLAVLGFVVVLIIGVWLAVQIVRVIPGTFASLASLAESVYSTPTKKELTINNSENILNHGESFTINWNTIGDSGVYSFTYTCSDGVAIDVRDKTNNIISVTCDEPLNLNSGATSLDITAKSAKRRFADVTYTLAFSETAGAPALTSKSNRFTIVNPNIPQNSPVVAAKPEAEETPAPAPVVEPTPAPAPTEPAAPTPVVAGTPRVIETTIMAIPVSDPNGFVDLEVKFRGVGVMSNNNVFTRTATIDNDVRGAFQFEVKNIGTKTSGPWNYSATLTSGAKFDGKNQTPLKPNERSIITLGFDAVGEAGFQTFGTSISGGNDQNKNNNDFQWAVGVTN